MAKFTLTIDCDNAAFEDDAELVRIVRHVADQIECGETRRKVRDVNGNVVGRFIYDFTE